MWAEDVSPKRGSATQLPETSDLVLPGRTVQHAPTCPQLEGREGKLFHISLPYIDRQGWQDDEHVNKNDQMLRNLLGPLTKAAQGLKSVQFCQGAKAYGLHVRGIPHKYPYKEKDPRVEHNNFYWRQEDCVMVWTPC